MGGIHRFDARRDSNDAPLMREAKKLGCLFKTYGPLDHWIAWPGQKYFVPLEIKTPEKRYQPSAYTQIEKDFIELCKELGIRCEIWSRVEDVLESRLREAI